MKVSAVVVTFLVNPATLLPIKLSMMAVAAGAVSNSHEPTIRTHVSDRGIASRNIQPRRVGRLTKNIRNVRPLPMNELARPATTMAMTSTPPAGMVSRVVCKPVKPYHPLISLLAIDYLTVTTAYHVLDDNRQKAASHVSD